MTASVYRFAGSNHGRDVVEVANGLHGLSGAIQNRSHRHNQNGFDFQSVVVDGAKIKFETRATDRLDLSNIGNEIFVRRRRLDNGHLGWRIASHAAFSRRSKVYVGTTANWNASHLRASRLFFLTDKKKRIARSALNYRTNTATIASIKHPLPPKQNLKTKSSIHCSPASEFPSLCAGTLRRVGTHKRFRPAALSHTTQWGHAA